MQRTVMIQLFGGLLVHWFIDKIEWEIGLKKIFELRTNEQMNQWTNEHSYSLLKLFTGLATAALIAWKLTVTAATNKAMPPAAKNTHDGMLMR